MTFPTAELEGGSAVGMHVDVVRNDWNEAKQVLLGHVRLLTDGLAFEVAEHGLEARLRERIPQLDGSSLGPEDGVRFLQALSRRWTGDVIAVSDVHDDSACVFEHQSVMRMAVLPPA